VHIHVLPRRPGDFEKNDEVYDELDRAEARWVLRHRVKRVRVVLAVCVGLLAAAACVLAAVTSSL
jgi:hypothetical protein